MMMIMMTKNELKRKGVESNLLERIIMLMMMLIHNYPDDDSESSRSSRLKTDCSAASLM